MSQPWTWEGAPEFKDWTFNGFQSNEIALLRIQSFETEMKINILEKGVPHLLHYRNELSN